MSVFLKNKKLALHRRKAFQMYIEIIVKSFIGYSSGLLISQVPLFLKD